MAAPLAAVAAGAGKALLRARVALRYVRVARALNRRRSRRRRWWLAGIVGMIFLPFLAVIALTMTALVFILLPFMRFDHLPSADALAEIPSRVLVAYDNAASAHCADTPVNWPVIAAIGYIESRHGTVGGRHVRDDFTIGPTPILGPVLDGTIPGTRARPIGPWAGEYGLPPDATHQQALGPMQFLPGTWQTTVDTHELQGKDPHNLEHAAQAVAAKLCEAVRRHGETHDDPRDAVRAALLGYNNSIMYGATVIAKALLLDAGDLSDPEGTTAYQLEFLEDTLSFVAIDELLEGPPKHPSRAKACPAENYESPRLDQNTYTPTMPAPSCSPSSSPPGSTPTSRALTCARQRPMYITTRSRTCARTTKQWQACHARMRFGWFWIRGYSTTRLPDETPETDQALTTGAYFASTRSRAALAH